jgi:uncharacterized SAM-binding protein YcdF (DUF218 family)
MYFLFTKELLSPWVLSSVGLLTLFGAYLWRMRKVREGRRLRVALAVACLLTLASNTQIGTFLPMRALEGKYPPLRDRPEGVTAIVVLSGGLEPADTVRPRPDLAEDTVFRCLHAADLYHQGPPCPIIVTGGKLNPSSPIPPVAELMRDLLLRLGVRSGDIVLEPQARTTAENAAYTLAILDTRGIDRTKVLLVTEAVHMPRSVKWFRAVGINPIAAPAHMQATSVEFTPRFFLPSPKGAKWLEASWHEWLGLAWDRFRWALSGSRPFTSPGRISIPHGQRALLAKPGNL